MITCNHKQKPYGYRSFGKNYEPAKAEIKAFRLWQCPNCGLWYALTDERYIDFEEVK